MTYLHLYKGVVKPMESCASSWHPLGCMDATATSRATIFRTKVSCRWGSCLEGHPLDLRCGISVASNLTSEHLELRACKSPQTSKLKNLFLESRPFHISDRNNPDKLTLLYFYII